MLYVGLDLGQAQDYTAIAIVERPEPKGIPRGTVITRSGVSYPLMDPADGEPIYYLRGLERVELGTPYTQVVRLVAGLVASLTSQGVQLIADATGVGVPVMDMLRAGGLSLVAVTIVPGGTVTDDGGGCLRVPKRDLAACIQVLLQNRRVKLAPDLPLAKILMDELRSFQVKVTPAAHDTYSAREGQHDDVVLAVALALWYAENRRPSAGVFADGGRHAEAARRERAEIFEGLR